jgi:Protein of unknown function (DUF2950)
MRRMNWQFDEFHRAHLWKIAASAVLVLGSFAAGVQAQQKGQKTFSSPEEASQALYTAAKNNDEKVLLELFGPDGKQVVSSGDEAEDTRNRAHFAVRYEEMNRLVKEPDGTVTLYIGAHNWPYPIPLRNKGNVWYFDTEAGRREILFRRIGFNEESAIRICQELAAAQKEYYAQQNNEYALKIFSDEGKKDGLYWKAAEGETQSPIGPLVAWANENAKSRGGEPAPYRGYYFHILTAQGKDSPGGAKSYLVNGKMTGGFAFVAYPAEYRSSGVMTFLVGMDGVVYEKDLGKKTDTSAKSMTEFNPGSGWHKTEEEQQAASEGGTTK